MSTKKDLQFQNQTSWQKVKNMNHFVFLSFCFGAKNRSPALGTTTRSLVVHQVSTGRIIVNQREVY